MKNIKSPDNQIVEVSEASAFNFLKKTKNIVYLVLFFCSSIIYVNTINNRFALDDQLAIYDNKFVKQGVSGIKDIFTHDAFVGFFGERGSRLISGGRYRPFSFATFALETQLFGTPNSDIEHSHLPFYFHMINVLLYGLLCVFVFRFLLLVFPMSVSHKDSNESKWFFSLAFLASLLFAFHPIHTEVVANIKGRDEILAFLFSLLAIVFSFEKDSYLDWKKQILIFLLFLIALLSKENAITFLGILPLVLFFQNKKWLDLDAFKRYLPFAVATLFYLVLRFKYTQTSVTQESTEILNNPFYLATTAQKYATILYSFIKYLWLLIAPMHLTHDYYYNQIPYKNFTDPLVLASIGMMLLVSFLLFKSYKKKTAIFFGLMFFIITFAIVSNVFFTVGIIMNERFVFTSSLGFCVLLAYGIQYLSDRLKWSHTHSLLIAVIICGIYSIKVYTRNQDWYDNFTLFSADYATSYHSAKVATALGGTYVDMSDTAKNTALKNHFLDTAIHILQRSIAIYPTNSQPLLLLGNAYLKRFGDNEKAKQCFLMALSYRSDGYFDGNYNMAIVYYNQGKPDSALYYIEKANKIDPTHKEARSLYSKLLAKLGRTDEALSLTRGEVGGDASIDEMAGLSTEARQGGNVQEAMRLADLVLEKNPNHAEANYNKGLCLARFMNKIPEGIPYLEKAIAANSSNVSWMEDLAVAYGFTGQVKQTIPLLEKVIAARPNDPNPYYNLATSYNMLGDKSKALFYKQQGDKLKLGKP